MATAYSINIYTAAELEAEYPNLWATINRHFPDLSPERQAIIGSLVLSTCHSCNNDDNNCQCWNDE